MKMKIPTVGEQYHFFDDGKLRESRHYMATVLEKITPEQAKDVYINRRWEDTPVSLYTIWREEIDRHRQGNTFKVLTSGSMEVGAPWLYAEKTDYFIKCSIPDYDENDVWFVRTIDGGWFSLDTVDTWMSGRLDVTGALFEYMNETIKEWQDMSSTT